MATRLHRYVHIMLLSVLITALAIFSVFSFGAAFTPEAARADIATALGSILRDTNVQNLPIGDGRSVSLQGGQIGIDLHEDQPGGGIADRPGCQGANCIATISGAEYSGIVTTKTFREAAQSWINFFLGFLGLIAVAMLIYAGFRYITSAGEDVDDAKKTIIYVAVGIIVIFFAYSVVNTLITFGPEGGDLASSVLDVTVGDLMPPTFEEYSDEISNFQFSK